GGGLGGGNAKFLKKTKQNLKSKISHKIYGDDEARKKRRKNGGESGYIEAEKRKTIRVNSASAG
ncbi:MAG: hypothetical protein Q6363_005190, partial [Candidatus Njordarchaeota archaeon]